MKNNVAAALNDGFSEPIRDALWGHIYLTCELESLTRCGAFIRLYRIAQLGPASLTYPGGTHTRAAHSLGVYYITRRLLANLASRGAAWLTATGIRSMLCAALLHDIGHFPYAHSLKELPLASHEALAGRIIRAEPVRSLVGKTGADPDLTAAVVDTDIDGKDFGGELVFYRKLLSGCLDPDKLDYLNRDARFCGVPYGAQDVDFILSTLIPHEKRGVDIESKGITGVESLLFSKYLMYRTVYWHHSVRCATTMVKKALLSGLNEQIIMPWELYNLDDEGLFSLLAAREHPLFEMALRVRSGQLFTTAVEIPFDEALFSGVDDIKNRVHHEMALAAFLRKRGAENITGKDIVLDVPECFSFETELFVHDKDCVFKQCGSVFSGETAAAFVKTLRIMRVFVDQPYKNSVKSIPVEEYLNLFQELAGG
ncbi:phosphohydrolase [Spirochaetia bacterium]|nr:phosphohydrolase [Spirochaetia bacterium]